MILRPLTQKSSYWPKYEKDVFHYKSFISGVSLLPGIYTAHTHQSFGVINPFRFFCKLHETLGASWVWVPDVINNLCFMRKENWSEASWRGQSMLPLWSAETQIKCEEWIEMNCGEKLDSKPGGVELVRVVKGKSTVSFEARSWRQGCGKKILQQKVVKSS